MIYRNGKLITEIH
jgi:hypothetical protein